MTDLPTRYFEIISTTTGTPVEDLAMDKSFDQLGYDSLDIVSLIMTMEDEFDIDIDDDYLRTLGTVEKLYAVVQEKLEKRTADADY